MDCGVRLPVSECWLGHLHPTRPCVTESVYLGSLTCQMEMAVSTCARWEKQTQSLTPPNIHAPCGSSHQKGQPLSLDYRLAFWLFWPTEFTGSDTVSAPRPGLKGPCSLPLSPEALNSPCKQGAAGWWAITWTRSSESAQWSHMRLQG